ncbi:MAG: DUF1015 domain-containing protein [Bacteroidales bacterium]|nr:DUF1015 domain-containing protein [Bacteroidales bacterium]MBN2757161.1 DUF1015 domain-containing protein [Bacteroidales bacterium]
MSIFRPFKGYRPKKENVNKVASRPYDVLNSDEARIEVKGNPYSFLHVVKPEVDLDVNVDLHSQIVYDKAKSNLQKLISDGMFIKDEKPFYYIYAQTMRGKTQYGLVGCSGVEDYMNNIIKKHELTRPDKEEDRMNHVRNTNVNAEPVFFTYRDNKKIDEIVNSVIKANPEYDFTTEDDFGHHFWIINDENYINAIQKIFTEEVKYQYVADGHHRTAAAALVGNERKKNNPNHTGNEEYNFFLSVIFPASQLTIIDYNRVVKDLNGLSETEFIKKLEKSFDITEKGAKYKPCCLHNFAMYIGGKWYSLKAKDDTYKENDPIGVLDVTILTNEVLEPILDIKDLRRSERIDFVGGIRGLGELQKRVDNGEMKAAFALFPVTMDQLMDIADNNLIMPPKVTWFEPKLRSGLVFHDLE